jgi:hypothetical protein
MRTLYRILDLRESPNRYVMSTIYHTLGYLLHLHQKGPKLVIQCLVYLLFHQVHLDQHYS